MISPIHDAAAKGNIGGLEEFVTVQGQDVDSRDNAQNTPLHYAAGAGHTESVGWLLDHGAAINAVNLLGDTALHRVRYFSHISLYFQRLMIELNCCVNLPITNSKFPWF